ncbi:glycosyltransferase [Blastococcus jejuensis]|uniref:Glycosyltransferase n=1 Tax=Blastococcus jejuensis TaxID=351224 RepID=A0ABP6PET6_9ACTN
MDGPRTLFVASTGGHLDELIRLRPRLQPVAGQTHWATADTEQSRELLAGESVSWMPVVPPKDWVGALASLSQARRVVRHSGVDRVVSTGAALALPFFVAGRLRGAECHYIESAARSVGPSLTGRLASRVPGVQLHTQYPAWADNRWRFAGSVFDGYRPDVPTAALPSEGLRRVVVTLGTQAGFSFRRSLEALLRELPAICAPDVEILWQTGGTDTTGLGIDATPSVSPAVLKAAIEAADLVVGHAGVGSALCTMDAGRTPLLMPRQAAYGEHTDDHQMLIAGELARRGLAVQSTPDELTAEMLLGASAGRVARTVAGPMYLTADPGLASRPPSPAGLEFDDAA